MEQKPQKRERFTQGLKVREAQPNEERIIEGTAIIADVETVLFEGKDYREIEVIDSAALDIEFFKTQDIKLNLLHERLQTLARNNKGKGTLQYERRDNTIAFSAPAPQCDLGAQAVALVENGTYTGCSFEFWPKDYQYSERIGADGKTEYVCRVMSFEYVTAFTIAMDPAYEQTSINAREGYLAQHPEIQEAKEREDKAKADAEAKAKEEEECKMRREREFRARQREIELMSLCLG